MTAQQGMIVSHLIIKDTLSTEQFFTAFIMASRPVFLVYNRGAVKQCGGYVFFVVVGGQHKNFNPGIHAFY